MIWLAIFLFLPLVSDYVQGLDIFLGKSWFCRSLDNGLEVLFRGEVVMSVVEARVYSVYKGYYQSSGQGFRAGLERVVVFHVAGVPGTVCSGGVAGFKGVDEGGKGSYTVGGMILERSFRRLGGGIRRCCLNSSGGEVEALLRRGSRWLKNRGDSPIS